MESFETAVTKTPVVVARRFPGYMDAEVLRVIAGDETRRTIRIWGGGADIFDLRRNIRSFPIDSVWVVAVYPLPQTFDGSGVAAGDYSLVHCAMGETHLDTVADANGASGDDLAKTINRLRSRPRAH